MEFAKKMKLAPLATLNLERLEMKEEEEWEKHAMLSERTARTWSPRKLFGQKERKAVHARLLESVRRTGREFKKNTSVLGIIFENTYTIKSPPKQERLGEDKDEVREEDGHDPGKLALKEYSLYLKRPKRK